MNFSLTYANLLNYHQQIQKQIQNNTVCSFFNRSKINEFYNNYDLRIRTAIEEIQKLNEKYYDVEKDEDDKPLRKIKDGMNESEYKDEMSKIMQREILI
jgi:hypothetical protein